jgi:uncharacterized protein YkwD
VSVRRLPFAVAGLLGALALAVPAAGALPADCTPAATWPAAQPDLAGAVVALVNAHRVDMGLQPLQASPSLTASAAWKARHMAALQYFAHDDPAPPAARSVAERLGVCGYANAGWGENIAMGYLTPPDVVAAWLASPGHRANIEDPAFRATGVAVAGTPLYWAQDFGAKVDAAAAASAPAPAAVPRLRAACAGQGRAGVACRVQTRSGTTIRVALRRAGTTLARARGLTQAGAVRLALRPARPLASGRYQVVVRAAFAAGTSERRLVLIVR